MFVHSTNFDKKLRNYTMTVDLTKSTSLVRSLMDKLNTLFKATFLGHDTSKMNVVETEKLTTEVIVKKDTEADMTIVTDSGTSHLEGVNLPSFLSQLSFRSSPGPGHQCTQSMDRMMTMDKLNISARPFTCWSLLSGVIILYPV